MRAADKPFSIDKTLVYEADKAVKAPLRSPDTGKYLPRHHLAEEPGSLRTLAERNCRRVRLMGAV